MAKDGFNAALAIDGKLGGEVSGSIDVGHGAGGEEEKLAEVALVQRKRADSFAGELFAAGGCGLGGGRAGLER